MGKRIQVLKRVLGVRGNQHPDLPRFFVMSDEKLLPNPEALLPFLPKGSAIILRHYEVKNREFLARRLIHKAHAKHVKVLIAGDERLAIRCGADGVHLPGYALNRRVAKRHAIKPQWLVSAAVHSIRAAAQAKKIEADFALISPVFETPSHPNQSTLVPLAFTAMVKIAGVKAIALGGINEETAIHLKVKKLWGFAGIGIFRI